MALVSDSIPDESLNAVQALLDRVAEGDRAAITILAERAYERLRRLSSRLLKHSFPALEGRHDSDSVLNRTWVRLWRAVAVVKPATEADFARLAAFKIRQILLELVADQRVRDERERPIEVLQRRDGGPSIHIEPIHEDDALLLAQWTDLHHAVDALPEDQQRVFEAHYYLGLTQSEISRLYALHPKAVSRLWLESNRALANLVLDRDYFRNVPDC